MFDFESLGMIIKLGSAGDKRGYKWKEKRRNQIFQIFVWYDDTCIYSIQFQYVENEILFLSRKFGSPAANCNFQAVRFNYPSEYLVSFNVGVTNSGYVGSLTFGTNQRTYGPYGAQNPGGKSFHFEMGEGQFAGFYGTEDNVNWCLFQASYKS